MSDDTAQRWSLLTRLIHEGERAPAPPAPPTATPIYTTSTYVYRDAAEWEAAIAGDGYVYGRNGNPTVAALERVMALAEGGMGALAFASGMAAMYAAILAAGTPRGASHPRPRGILVARDIYGVTTVLLEKFFAAQGVPVAFCDMCDLAAVDEALAQHRPDVLVAEQISNPLLRVVDIAGLAQRARAAGARLIVDNTIATPILQRPLTLGADMVVHSATKYLGGHGDVTGGVVVTRASLPRDTLRSYLKILGGVLGPFEAQQILRGVKTLALRVRQQCANAARVAAWLAEQPQVERVYYPGLPSHPQHALAASSFGGLFGAMVSFDLRGGGREALYRFINALRLILPATSLGDVYTLVSAPMMSSHRDLTPEQRAARGIGDGMVRLSIGIEDVDDLLADLRDALAAV
ncbi:MAG TPA: aminotransferase class I/II-fold pyridoxal phosphate-dependent enzyme [Roseiflexaceae bacterium]|nr:aminotransferase class I/II-fold pyridoxal phosphate-dependent enzyme [Roseiflexaceae bacterium]